VAARGADPRAAADLRHPRLPLILVVAAAAACGSSAGAADGGAGDARASDAAPGQADGRPADAPPPPDARLPGPDARVPDATVAVPDGPVPDAQLPDAGAPEPDAMPCTPVGGQPDLALELVARGLIQPVVITQPPGEARLFVAELGGRIEIIEDGQPRKTFLEVQVASGSEQGLLGMAFHPGYAQNGRFFINFIDVDGNTRIWEYARSAADPSLADPHELEILKIDQPAYNHNGGNLLFGPDGMLYIGMGDGGDEYDPSGIGQDLDTRLGKMLRIDVDVGGPAVYASPPDNPFFDRGGPAADIWAYGLRNPWRWSFDRETGDQWIGDVGQDNWEEIDLIPHGTSGQNFGWGVVEGTNHCPKPPYTGVCTVAGMTPPVLEYDHDFGVATIGGYVYRGCRMPGWRGTYFFSDDGSGFIRSFPAGPGPVDFAATTDWPDLAQPDIATMGEDAGGELLLCSLSLGQCWRIVPKP
jgi:glucose/arabinose dehydrogenase